MGKEHEYKQIRLDGPGLPTTTMSLDHILFVLLSRAYGSPIAVTHRAREFYRDPTNRTPLVVSRTIRNLLITEANLKLKGTIVHDKY